MSTPHNSSDPDCERCGAEDAFDFAGTWLCQACYQLAADCCSLPGASDARPVESDIAVQD